MDSSSESDPASRSDTMVSRRSRACSKLAPPSSAEDEAGAGPGDFLFAGIVSSGSYRFDACIRLAARELDRDGVPDRQPVRGAQQGTVGATHEAITAFHDQTG